MTTYTIVGHPVGRVEGPDKVTGRALYPADVQLPGMLWAKVLRSPLPHARILSIDTSRARRLPGVHAVLTGADIPGVRTGRMLKDIPLLAQDRVRFVGEKVAVVAAEEPDIAEEALLLIDVEYEELPAVFDPLEAQKPEAPILHEDLDTYERGQAPLWTPNFPKPVESPSNLFSRWSSAKGDIEEGFAQADYIFEHTFTLPMVHQGYLEPHACVVQVDDQGQVQIWVNSKQPHQIRRQVAAAAGIDPENVRVNVNYIGGDFGGKGGPMDAPLIYYVAKATERPVKMVMTYMEEFMAADPRHPGVITIRSGVKKDGTLVARHVHGIFNSGAYAAFKPAGNLGGIPHAAGCYRIPHVLVQADCVYTNTIPRGHARAPGSPQAAFAGESHMDMIASEMGMDPLEFRLKNVLQEGDASPVGHEWHQIKAEETLRAAAESVGWSAPKAGPHVGRGLALFEHPTGAYGEGIAWVTLAADGTITVQSPNFDQGTGIHTIQCQIVAEELTLPMDQVHSETVDTDHSPFDVGVGGSRTTHCAGQAALLAARDMRRQLTALAAELLATSEEVLQLREGRFTVGEAQRRSVSVQDLAARIAAKEPLSVQAIYQPEQPHETSFCTQAAEVEVDQETGQVKLTRFITVVDSGTVLNPITYRGQVNGGVIMGLGYALMEEMPVEEGRVQTVHFGDYKIPTIQDIPELTTILLEEPSGPTPYQGKAVGETANCPVAAAVANAVADAVGARITGLPITSEKVRNALEKR